ncbi:MAG: exonuclease, polymerase epsilon subunit family [Acidimicrobiales bacterium]|nr:exonuclease, polymerase epsilon subunit family [Acidimicrobiales bacterium]
MQRSFDDLGTPLQDVTFCVIDIETTGGSAADGGITEIGAVKLRGGECLGTLRTFVNPGCSIPRQITVLTGITEAMVEPAPPVDAVLPVLLEFLGDAVVVGHNVRYDLGYINAALERSGRARLANPEVDTCALARRLVRDEVPNCRLGTLAQRFRLAHRPSHRALDDALATGDLLHVLLERAAAFGVLGLDDLVGLPKMGGHPQAAKLKLTDHLPRSPGVYLFRDGAGRTLYVGKATNLRSRVRSYFSSDERRKIGSLLRETQRIDHVVCASPLEAAVIEVRLIHRLDPRFNRQATTWRRATYLKLTVERFPRLSVVREVRGDGAFYLGPLPSAHAAKRVAEAIETAVPLRRCTGRPGRAVRSGPCAPAQIGVATCPCAGQIGEQAYAGLVATVVRGLTVEPSLLLAPLDARMRALAAAERFEEAADMRDRAGALAQALRRQRRFEALRRAGRIVIEVPGRSGAELRHGRLVRSWSLSARGQRDTPLPLDLDPSAPEASDLGPQMLPTGHPEPLPKALADELGCVAAWLDREAATVRLVHCDRGLSSPFPALPSFAAAR